MSNSSNLSLPCLLTGKSFESIRALNANNLYIDKTAFLPKILVHGSPLFVRPRRFGKSTMLSTIYSLVTGNREIFKGLAVDDTWEWKETFPVFRFDFTQITQTVRDCGKAALHKGIGAMLKFKALLHHEIDVPISDDNIPAILEFILCRIKSKFQEETGSKNGVIILLDEYDYLLQPHILRPHKKGLSDVESALQDFFGSIKGLNSANIVASLISTGICKIGGLNLFTSLNFITDVSGKPELADMMGYTREEILHYFEPFIDSAITTNKLLSIEDLIEELARLYNGYAFSLQNINCTVFNPFSILHFFKSEQFEAFWFSNSLEALTHQPYCDHIEALLQNQYTPTITEKTLGPAEVVKYTIDKMLFFTGYLTLKSDPKPDPEIDKNFILDWPNAEVSSRFSIWYAQIQTQLDMDALLDFSTPLRNSLLRLQVDRFCLELQIILRSLNHQFFEKKLARESHFHLITDLALKLSSMDFTLSELVQAEGRIDLISYIGRYCYIFELKIVEDESPENITKKIQEIKNQVSSKKYSHGVPGLTKRSKPYQQCVIGLVFAKSRNLVAYTIISSPNKELLPEKDVMDIVERAPAVTLAANNSLKIKRDKLEEEEPSTENEGERWPNHMRQMQELYEQMLTAVQDKARAQIETERLKGRAEANEVRLKAEADANEVRLKAEAEANEVRLKAEAEQKDFYRRKIAKTIRRLEKQNNTPHEICDLLILTPEEWYDITGEELSEEMNE